MARQELLQRSAVDSTQQLKSAAEEANSRQRQAELDNMRRSGGMAFQDITFRNGKVALAISLPRPLVRRMRFNCVPLSGCLCECVCPDCLCTRLNTRATHRSVFGPAR